MLIVLYMLLVQALNHVVLLSEGELLSLNVDSEAKVEVENSCEENIDIYRISIEKMMQQLPVDDFVKFLAFPSNTNIIFGLEKQGRLKILYQYIDGGEFRIQQDLNLNPGGLPEFECSDMTPASELVYLAVCIKKQEIYIVKIQCNVFVVCESILIDGEKQSQGCTDAKITSESWRMQDPKYFSIYCSSIGNGSQSHIYIIDGSQNGKMHKVNLPLNFVQKVSFFDENTLMILDQQFGLFVIKFFVSDTVYFNILLQQKFLFYESYYQMSYSIEQSSIRFPPKGIVQNDIQFSLVIVSNLYLYELVLPSKSEDFRNNLLPISDKIFIKGNYAEELHYAILSYDELFYFLCLSGTQENRCIRYRRHSKNTESRELLSNSLNRPIMLSYIVAYSTTPGQTNIMITQGDRLTLISNQDEKLIVQVKQAMKCKLTVDSELYDLWISPVNVAEIYIIQNQIEKQFQTPQQRIELQNIVRGPAPYLTIQPGDNNVLAQLANGYEFPMPPDIYEQYFEMARYRKLFNDNGFRITFVQNRKIDMIIEYMSLTEEQFVIEIFQAECTYQAIIRQIEGVSPYYLIFYQYVNEYSIIKFTNRFEFTCETKPLPIEEDHEIIIDLDFYNVFFNTDSGIYYINLEEDVLYKIEVQRRYRQLSFKYLNYNIIVGSWQGNLEILELDKPYRGHVFKSSLSNILLNVGSHDFRFLIFVTNRILIIDDDIRVYAIENLLEDQLQLACIVPLMGFKIIKATIVLNGHILIVPLVGDTLAFVYDLRLTGAEQLIQIEDWQEFPAVAIDSYLNQNEFHFCFEIHDATIRCMIRPFIYIMWIQDQPSNFTLNFIAFSTFNPTHNQNILMNGQFSYQDTVIQTKKDNTKLEIYKSNGKSALNLTNYFTGPIFEYSLQDTTATITTFVKPQKSIPINHNADKVYGIFVNKDYLIILAESAISVIKIAEIQYIADYQEVQITYEEINKKLKSYNQPSVQYCQLAFINPLSITTLQRINILAMVCVTEVLKLNYLYFTILNGNIPIKEQFIENIFFIPLDIDDYIQQAQGSMKLQTIEMINYPINLTKYKFGTISVTLKENDKFESNQQDHVITVFVGLVDLQVSPLIQGKILCEIGAQTFNQNNLKVNNLQVSCLKGCTIENEGIDTEVELVFNDQYDFNFYLVRIHVEYQIKSQMSSYKILEQTRVSLAQEQFQFAYIDTRVSKVNEGRYLLNVTTDTVSFDMTYEKGKTKVEQVFKQYTTCLSPSGSLTASYKQFFAITCRKDSFVEKDQIQYVKVFIRENQNLQTSVVEGIPIEGQVVLLDIDKSSASEDIQLLILEQQESKFKLRQFILQSKFILSANDKTPNKEFKVALCAKNIVQTQCTDLVISNIGYGDYKFNEWLLFVLFIFVPCILSVICIICGITSYKKEKMKRIVAFGDSLEKQINSTQVNLSNTNNNTFSLRKGSSAMDIFHH